MILITGCARSGTSLTTGIINACGASLGSGRVNALNEAVDVRDGLVKPYLKSIGADPLGQFPLPDTRDVEREPAPSWREKVLEGLGHPEEPWAYKGAKMCLMWQVWNAAFPEAKWVIIRRDREKIIDSCIRTSFMRAFGSSREGWGDWHDFHVERFEEMKAAMPGRVLEFWPGIEVDGFREVVEWSGLPFNRDAAQAVINPGKWHG